MSMPQVPAKVKQTATVIFLHGLGDTGHGWCQAFEDIAEPFVKYLFPTAKIQPVSLNFGMKMPSWFDIKGMSFDKDEDKAGIQESTNFCSPPISSLLGGLENKYVVQGLWHTEVMETIEIMVSFISNQKKRQRFDSDNVRQLKAKVAEWYVKTKVPIACFVYINGRVNFITTPDIRELGKNAELQSIISRYICENNAASAEDDSITSDMNLSLPENFNPLNENVRNLRDIVMDIVTSKGKRNAYWGIESRKPYWWPDTVRFVSPKNNRSPDRPKRADLVKIVQCFIDSRPLMPLNANEELDNIDEGVDDNVISRKEDIESLCDMIKPEMTVDDGKTVLHNLASFVWSDLEHAAKNIAITTKEICQSSLPRLEDPVQERHIRIWSRHLMPEKAVGYEPVDIVTDNNSLFRAASRIIYHKERFWPLLKIGSLVKAIAESDHHAHEISHGEKFDLADNDAALEQFKNAINDSMLGTYSNDYHYSLKTFLVEVSSLSRFVDINVRIVFENNEEILVDNTKSERLLFLVSDANYHVMPLVKLENEISLDTRPRCDARARCIGHPNEEESIKCKNCLWTYHPSCVGKSDVTDDCGCIMIPEAGIRLDAFKSFSFFKTSFDEYETDLQALVEGLFCGSNLSCRIVKKEQIRHELNCFVGGLPFDVDHYVVSRVGDWIEQEKIEAPVDKRRLDELFCHVATREVEMFIIIKETKLGRLTVERAARKILGAHYPSPDMWLHMPK